MCGIAGLWGRDDGTRLRVMSEQIRHRGPDGRGHFHDTHASLGLAHTRLSIIDLESGQQPMTTADGALTIVYNGEIYNYVELRRSLESRGDEFVTHSDTETILHLYRRYGTECVDHLRGMFAFALWDRDRQELLLARDRLGKKPLYYAHVDGEFLFASELKSLVAGMTTTPTVDDQALVDYLGWGMVVPPRTIYRNVCALPAATTVVVRDRKVVHSSQYWRLDPSRKESLSFEQAVDQLDASLREAVRIRLRSDVEVGAFLSGGLDSGVVVAMAVQEGASRIKTFTVGDGRSQMDERGLAKQVADRFGTDHHEFIVRPDSTTSLQLMARAFDQPYSNTSAIPSFAVAKEASAHVKVVLSGDGGDELLGGYRRHKAAQYSRLWNRVDSPVSRRLLAQVHGWLPQPKRPRGSYEFAHRFVEGLAAPPVARHIKWTVDLVDESLLQWLCPKQDWYRDHAVSERHAEALLAQYQDARPADTMMVLDARTVLADNLNLKADLCSMHYGVEVRCPLLDHVVAEQAMRIPESVKLRGVTTKPLMRALAQRYLPQDIVTAPKRGFEVPMRDWLGAELAEIRDDVVLSSTGLLADRFDRDRLHKLIDGRAPVTLRKASTVVVTLLMLGLWDRLVHRGV